MDFLQKLLALIFGGKKLPPGPNHNNVPPSKPTQTAPRPAPGPAAPPAQPSGGGAGDFIGSLRGVDKTALKQSDYTAAASALGCEPEAVMAVVAVESGSSGFGKDLRPLILFEPHIFSRLTKRAYDASHPSLSYLKQDRSKYPGSQSGRWEQLTQAAALDLENAVASASWGRFQIMGFNAPRAGFASAKEFVAYLSQSEAHQLQAFVRFVTNSGLADELARQDWAGFAQVYNGPTYADNKYDTRLAEAFAKFKKKPAGV